MKNTLKPWAGWGCRRRSEGQGEGSVAQVGEDIHPAAVTCSCQDLALRRGGLLVEAEAEQPWGGARHLGLQLPAQLPLVDTAALASRQNQVLVEGDMLLWRPNGEDSGRCGGSEVPEGEGWAPPQTIQSESVAKHPIQRPLWGLEHSSCL